MLISFALVNRARAAQKVAHGAFPMASDNSDEWWNDGAATYEAYEASAVAASTEMLMVAIVVPIIALCLFAKTPMNSLKPKSTKR